LLKKELETMLELDRLNKKILMLRNEFKNLPSKRESLLKEISEKEQLFKAEKEHFEDQKMELSYLQDEVTEFKKEVKALSDKLSKDEENESLLKDYEDQKRLLIIREEELLSGETLLKDTVEVVQESENDFTTTKESNEAELLKLKTEESNFMKEIKEINEKQEVFFNELDAIDTNVNLVSLYQEINEAFPGGVVSRVENDSCSRCFIQITPQILNEIYREAIPDKRHDEIITCPSCKCILYIDPMDVEE